MKAGTTKGVMGSKGACLESRVPQLMAVWLEYIRYSKVPFRVTRRSGASTFETLKAFTYIPVEGLKSKTSTRRKPWPSDPSGAPPETTPNVPFHTSKSVAKKSLFALIERKPCGV